jgi:glycosyltransferase involved in cell wall biosynthesis
MTARSEAGAIGPHLSPDLSGMRVIIVNWRDPWHREAGGAERYAWEMARALTACGAEVRFLTARGPGQSAGEHRDGVEVVRRGGRFTVYPLALGWLLAHRESAGMVLDCQNGIPFFTPLVMPRCVPVLWMTHHVDTAQFGADFPAWMAWARRLLEGPASRLVYRKHGCVAVWPSTVTATRERLRWTGDIYLVADGTPAPADPAPVGRRPRLVWIGRLVEHTRAELLLPAAARGFAIDVIGRGPGSAALSAAAVPAGTIHLHGYLPEEDKLAIVRHALLHLNTSQGEGWGLCVLEAASLGVPTVADDVEGLRDAVRDGQTGWLVRDGEELADVVERAARELDDPARRAEMAAACRAWAARLSWDRATARMAGLVRACVTRGTSRATRDGAWIVSRADGGVVVAEGPAPDLLIDAGSELVRRATPAEHLLAEVSGSTPTAGPARSP